MVSNDYFQFDLITYTFGVEMLIDFKLRNLKKVSSEEFKCKIKLNFLKPNICVVLNILILE